MLSLKKLFIILLVVISLGLAYHYYKKVKGTEKLKISALTLKSEKTIKNLSDIIDIFQNGLPLAGYVQIRNLSGQDYTLNQISIDGYTPKSNKRIAQQTNIQSQDIVLKNKQDTQIPLAFQIDILSALDLFKESGVIPENTTLWEVITQPAQYYESTNLNQLKITLKGFIEVEGFTLNIDQSQKLYE